MTGCYSHTDLVQLKIKPTTILYCLFTIDLNSQRFDGGTASANSGTTLFSPLKFRQQSFNSIRQSGPSFIESVSAKCSWVSINFVVVVKLNLKCRQLFEDIKYYYDLINLWFHLG